MGSLWCGLLAGKQAGNGRLNLINLSYTITFLSFSKKRKAFQKIGKKSRLFEFLLLGLLLILPVHGETCAVQNFLEEVSGK